MANKVAFTGYMIINPATGEAVVATITVYDPGTANLSTIYDNEAGTPKANPFTTDAYGRVEFYADEGEYDIQVSGVGITTYKIEDVSIIGYASQYMKGVFDGDYKCFLVEW